jgi:uncharacterized phage-like protein YoqJ
MDKLIVAGTGHRPDKLIGGWDNQPAYRDAVVFARDFVLINGESGVVSGVAAGWDLMLAEGAIEASIPVMAAVPFKGQEKRWSTFWQERYEYVLSNATRVEVISSPDIDSKYEVVQALYRRNTWMVEYIKGKKGKMYALWNGTKGGTAHCIRSAERQGVEVVNFWAKYKFICGSHNPHNS